MIFETPRKANTTIRWNAHVQCTKSAKNQNRWNVQNSKKKIRFPTKKYSKSLELTRKTLNETLKFVWIIKNLLQLLWLIKLNLKKILEIWGIWCPEIHLLKEKNNFLLISKSNLRINAFYFCYLNYNSTLSKCLDNNLHYKDIEYFSLPNANNFLNLLLVSLQNTLFLWNSR